MANQTHVFVRELEYEKQRWKIISEILKSFCLKNNLTFLHRGSIITESNTSDKVLYTFLFDNFSYDLFDRISREYESLAKKVYFIVDSWIDKEKFVRSNSKVFSRPQLFGLTAIPGRSPSPVDQKKLFNCFIHRTEAVRQSWFYFLYLRGLLEQGYVSYRLYQFNTNSVGVDLFDVIHKNHLCMVPHFEQAYKDLRSQIPYCNFIESDDLSPLINSTKYSLVLDTYAPDDDVGTYYISEKVTRSLQLATNNLLFVQKGTIQKLHDIGLSVDQSLLDIDKLPWLARQQKLLEILENDMINVNVLHRVESANHNRNILNHWAEKCLTNAFYTDIFDIISAD